jgi:6-phosphogluconolactonase (cycloisomerase 2 family)
MTSVFDGAGAGLNQGMTALSITRDGSLVAVGRTDNTISLYSIDAATTHASAQEHLQPDPKYVTIYSFVH